MLGWLGVDWQVWLRLVVLVLWWSVSFEAREGLLGLYGQYGLCAGDGRVCVQRNVRVSGFRAVDVPD